MTSKFILRYFCKIMMSKKLFSRIYTLSENLEKNMVLGAIERIK